MAAAVGVGGGVDGEQECAPVPWDFHCYEKKKLGGGGGDDGGGGGGGG